MSESTNERGERIDVRTGAVKARIIIPERDLKPCPAEAAADGRHDTECECLGTKLVPILRPRSRAIDPADDSIDAMFEALAEPDRGEVIDESILQPDYTLSRGGGGRSGKKGKKVTGEPMGDPLEGALETGETSEQVNYRRGKPPAVGGTTRDKDTATTVDPKTAEELKAKGRDTGTHLAAYIERVFDDPRAEEILREERARAASAAQQSAS